MCLLQKDGLKSSYDEVISAVDDSFDQLDHRLTKLISWNVTILSFFFNIFLLVVYLLLPLVALLDGNWLPTLLSEFITTVVT